MKKIISKLPFFIISISLFLITTFLFGVTIGGRKFFGIYLAFTFFISSLIYWLYDRKTDSTKKLKITCDFIGMLLFSFFIIFIIVEFYFSMNEIKSEFIKEFDTVATSVYGKIYGEDVFFNDLDGNQQTTTRYDWRIIRDNCISSGDIIHVKEMDGFFNVKYYILEF